MPSAPAASSRHTWKFFRTGGLDQVTLATGADLLALEQLDQKLWVALSCPVKGLELDEKTLALIDTDGDGRIRVPELLAIIKWAAAHLKDAGDLLKETDTLPLAALNEATPEGKAVLASATRILSNLGKKSDAISLADVSDTAKIFAGTKFNGDGVITAASAGDAAAAQLVADIMATKRSAPDRSGVPGVNQKHIDDFFADCTAYATWAAANGAPLGDKSAAALTAVKAVRAKVEDFFARCRLAAFDARATAAVNRAEADFVALSAKDLATASAEIAQFPLARIEPGRALPLSDGVNPAWADAIAALHAAAVTPTYGAGKISLTASEWSDLNGKLAAYEAWTTGKAGGSVEALGLDRVKAILAGQGKETLTALVAQDAALAPEAAAIGNLEKLLRCTRDLRTLLHNFVNFADFYARKNGGATFQAGTLYLDSRSCDLCIRVDAPQPLAAMSKAYIAYVNCTRAGGAAMTVACCFTQGDGDYLFVGRHGVFYDRKGRDWDAVITSLVESPISLRQAFWSPYKKFIRMIDQMAAKRAAAADAASNDRLGKIADKTVDAAANAATKQAIANTQPTAPELPKKLDVGVVAALGVAVGAIGGALATVGAKLVTMAWWQFPLIFIGLILAISLPAVIIAFLKLRQRNIGPILDANGWAINGRVKINIPFGTALTARAVLPPGAIRSLEDPYEDKAAVARRRRIITLIVVLVLGYLAWARYNPQAPAGQNWKSGWNWKPWASAQ
ncbi:MAG: hypothetical protein Q8N18_05525 [Opitutaceae bacterium]|nr:hypothetical protein [Opitutaceae bacterium]